MSKIKFYNFKIEINISFVNAGLKRQYMYINWPYIVLYKDSYICTTKGIVVDK